MNTATQSDLQLLIVDDSEVVLKGLRALLDAAAEFTIIGEAANVKSAVAISRELNPISSYLIFIFPMARVSMPVGEFFAAAPTPASSC